MAKSTPPDDGFEEIPRPRSQPRPAGEAAEQFEQDDRPPRPTDSPRKDEEDDDRPRRRQRRPEGGGDALSGIIPYKNGMALAAYYCGVFGLIPCVGAVLGPLSIIFGAMGLRKVNAEPSARGTGHAITGIVLGSLETLGHLIVFVLFVIGIASNRR